MTTTMAAPSSPSPAPPPDPPSTSSQPSKPGALRERWLAAVSRLTLMVWMRVAEFVAALGAVAVVVPIYGACFGGTTYLTPMLGAVLVAAVALIASVRLQFWGRAAVIAAGVLVTAILVLLPTFQSALPTAATWEELQAGVAGGWLRLLTSTRPVDPTPAVLLTPALLTYWCAWSAGAACLRGKRTAGPVLPGLIALVLALVVGGSAVTTSFLLVGAWLVLAVTALLTGANRIADGGLRISAQAAEAVGLDLPAAQRRSLSGRLVLGVPVALVIVAVGVAGAATLPIARGTERFDVRELIPQPIEPQQALSPLSAVQNQLLNPGDQLFTVVGLPAQVDRVRVATLSRYDGRLFTDDEPFQPAGSQLPGDGLAAAGSVVTIRVNIDRPALGGYVPTVGTPMGATGKGLGYAAGSGTLITTTGATATSYEFTARVPDSGPPAGAALETAVDPKYTALPSSPADPAGLADKARRVVGTSTGLAAAVTLATSLQELPYSTGARAGHSYGVLGLVLTGWPETAQPPETSFAEQRAAALVLMARALGIPARVAVGYLVERSDGAAGGSVDVRTGTATAWAEVPVRGFGWFPLDVVTRTDVVTESTETVGPPEVAAITVLPTTSGDSGTAAPTAAAASVGRTVWVALALAAAILLVPVLLVLGEKQRRRWSRRRASTPAARVAGAWRDVEDRLVERGLTVRASSSPLEVAHSGPEVTGEAIGSVAVLASTALYAPEEPTAEFADNAWKLARQARRQLGAGLPWWRRLEMSIDPRPLFGRRLVRGRHR
jgi:Transglutaminase-like superfamily